MQTKTDIEYRMNYKTVIIPAGTSVLPANNLPYPENKGFWAEPWSGITEEEESWLRNYGFLVNSQDVI